MYFSIRFLSLVCLLSQSTVVFRLSEASKDVGFKRQVFENVVTEVECCKCKEKIRVNPYDMLNYVHGAKTMKENNEKPSNFNGESCPQTDTIQVQSRLYLQRFVNQLLLASGLKDSRLDSGHKIVHMELNISYVELKLMHEFANTGTVTLERIDGILSRILRPKNVKSVHKGSGFLSDIDFVYYSKVVWATLATVPFDYPMVGIACFVSIVFIITVRHMRRYTLFYSMVLMLFIIFCSGFGWNWLRMIKEEEAKIASTYALHLKQLPIHCRPHDMTWYQRIWYHSYEKDCEKYFKEISIDPVVRISPTLVLSETLTMVLLHPAGKIGSAFGEFLAALIDPIPFAHKWYLVPLMLILLFFTGFLTYVVLIGGVISFRTLLCSFEIGRRDRSTRHMVEDMRQARRMIEEVRHEEDGGGRRIEGGGGGREIEGGRDWRIEGGGSDREGGIEGGSYRERGIEEGSERERGIEGGSYRERGIEGGSDRERGVEGGRRIEGERGGEEEKVIIEGGIYRGRGMDGERGIGRGMDEERGIGERSERERGIKGEKRIDNWRTPESGRVRILENSEKGVGSGRKRIGEDIDEENEWREIGWRIAGNVGKGERGTPENERLVRGERSGSGRRKFLEEGGERRRRLMAEDDEGEEQEWRTAEKGGGSSVRRRIGEGVGRGRRELDEGGSGDSPRRKGRGGIREEGERENEEEEERKHGEVGSSYEGVCEKCGSEGRKTKGYEKYVSGKVREEDEEKGGGEGKKCVRRLVEQREEERESWERRIDQKKSEKVVKRRSKMADYERVLTDDEEEEKEERGGEEEEEEEEDNLNKNFSPRAFEELKSIYKRFRKIVAKEDTDSSEMSSPDISGFERIEK